MLLGQFDRAWQESNEIARRGCPDSNCLWDGKRFAGKRIIIRCLHGLGDAIQFIRYAPLIRTEARSVVAEVPKELLSLFLTLPYLDRVVSWADGSSKDFTAWDQQVEVMELPRIFKTTVSSIPSTVPYIHVDSYAREESDRRLPARNDERRVGLLWASGTWNAARSLPVSLMSELVRIPDIQLFSFQQGCRRADLDLLRTITPVYDTADESSDILRTASNLVNMDIFVTVDTMAAHLAGALGVQTYLILPFEADWRWMLATSRTPWYPSVKIFRQPAPGNWGAVIESVCNALLEL